MVKSFTDNGSYKLTWKRHKHIRGREELHGDLHLEVAIVSQNYKREKSDRSIMAEEYQSRKNWL